MSVTLNEGVYKLTQSLSLGAYEVVERYAKKAGIDIVLSPELGSIDAQYDKWRRKFMCYQLDDEEKAFMKNVYASMGGRSSYSRTQVSSRLLTIAKNKAFYIGKVT
jgi:hypothetical protein